MIGAGEVALRWWGLEEAWAAHTPVHTALGREAGKQTTDGGWASSGLHCDKQPQRPRGHNSKGRVLAHGLCHLIRTGGGTVSSYKFALAVTLCPIFFIPRPRLKEQLESDTLPFSRKRKKTEDEEALLPQKRYMSLSLTFHWPKPVV